jgi:tRNA-binding EMAP/Myf-like protein
MPFLLSAKKEDKPKLDASRFDFRIGKINSIKKHPDADSLFVEESKLSKILNCHSSIN